MPQVKSESFQPNDVVKHKVTGQLAIVVLPLPTEESNGFLVPMVCVSSGVQENLVLPANVFELADKAE